MFRFPSCQVGSTTDCQKFYSVDTAQTIPPFPAALVSDPLQIYKGAQLNWTKRHFWKYNSAAGLAALNLQDPWNLFLAGSDNILISFVLQAEPKYWTNPAHETRIIHNPSVIWPNLNPTIIVIIVLNVIVACHLTKSLSGYLHCHHFRKPHALWEEKSLSSVFSVFTPTSWHRKVSRSINWDIVRALTESVEEID